MSAYVSVLSVCFPDQGSGSTWELVIKANSPSSPDAPDILNTILGMEPSNLVITVTPGDSVVC